MLYRYMCKNGRLISGIFVFLHRLLGSISIMFFLVPLLLFLFETIAMPQLYGLPVEALDPWDDFNEAVISSQSDQWLSLELGPELTDDDYPPLCHKNEHPYCCMPDIVSTRREWTGGCKHCTFPLFSLASVGWLTCLFSFPRL